MAAVTEQVALLINAASKIVWPVAITVLLLKYRRAVIDLLGNTKKVSAAGLEIEFLDRTRDVLADLDRGTAAPRHPRTRCSPN